MVCIEDVRACCLINAENLHIVCSIDKGRLYIITAYRPSQEQWENDGKKRKEVKL